MYGKIFQTPVSVIWSGRKALPGLFCLIVAMLAVAGCGTLDVVVEPAAQATATTATIAEETAAPTVETAVATQTATPTPQPSEPTVQPTATVPAAEPTATALAFEATTFRSDPLGFEFDYPAAWSVSDQNVIGDRGSAIQFFDGDNVVMQMTIYRWDPTNDLTAYISHWQTAWLASGMTLLAQEDWLLDDDHPAASFVLQGQAGDKGFFFYTPIADRYLELSGSQDMELLAAIARSVRLFEPITSSDAAASLSCLTADSGTAEWVACNVMDGLHSRNLAALPGFMADPFIIGYWASEGVSITPEEAIGELRNNLLPADPSAYPLTFTVDRSQFPPLQGIPVEGMFGPDVSIAHIIYSEGWGQDGQGAALIYIAQNPSGGYYWHGLVFSGEHFDK